VRLMEMEKRMEHMDIPKKKHKIDKSVGKEAV
jgi:hypothetical protein